MQLVIDIGNTQPKYPINLTVYPDGKALVSSGADLYEVGVKTLGEHGELTDKDRLLKDIRLAATWPSKEWCRAIGCVENALVVLEASR